MKNIEIEFASDALGDTKTMQLCLIATMGISGLISRVETLMAECGLVTHF